MKHPSRDCRPVARLLIPLALACFGLAPMAQGVGPDTDGSIPGSNNGEGIGVLISRTTGVWNTGTGFEALSQLTAGNQNTATGLRALTNDTNGGFNTATGVLSLFSNTNGFFNSATGAYSLANNISGTRNTANGYAALYRNTDDDNTAAGFAALYHNIIGAANTAVGSQALFSNTTGAENTANGVQALFNNTGGTGGEGRANTASGYQALYSNTFGGGNTAIGDQALFSNIGGGNNTGIGNGVGSAITGSGNVCIGAGVNGAAGTDNTTWIRNVNTTAQAFSAGVNNYVTVRLSDGRLGHTTVVSSRRYKEDIKPMDKTSEALYALKPVTFRLKKQFDATQARGFGLIAEEVEKVDPDLVYRNEKSEVESVRYEMVNAMLLNEFLKEHKKVQDLEATVIQQQKGMEVLTAQLKEQAAQIQKVSAQLELNKPAPRTVANDQ